MFSIPFMINTVPDLPMYVYSGGNRGGKHSESKYTYQKRINSRRAANKIAHKSRIKNRK